MAKQKKPQRKTLRVSQIRFAKQHWDREYSTTGMAELKEEIAENGQLYNVLVRPSKKSSTVYELIAGGRRFTAIKNLGLDTIDVTVVDVDDLKAEKLSITENLRYEKPTSADWAAKLERLRQIINIERGHHPDALPKGGRKSTGKSETSRKKQPVSEGPVTVGELAEMHNVSRDTVLRAQKRERNLIPEAKAAWAAKQITVSQADELAELPSPKQKALLKDFLYQNAQDAQAKTDKKRDEPEDSGPSKAECRQVLRECEVVCRKELIPKLHTLIQVAEDEEIARTLGTMSKENLTEARDLIDSLLDSLDT